MVYLFSKTECGPCILVKKYFKAMIVSKSGAAIPDPRLKSIEEITLDDGCSEEILNFAKKYNVTATPVVIIIGEDGNKLDEYVGGVSIIQNIGEILTKYVSQPLSDWPNQ